MLLPGGNQFAISLSVGQEVTQILVNIRALNSRVVQVQIEELLIGWFLLPKDLLQLLERQNLGIVQMYS